MSGTTVASWKALDDKLVFDIEPEAVGTASAIISIYWYDAPGNKQRVKVFYDRMAEFNLKVSATCYVFGYFCLRKKPEDNGMLHVGVFANIHYGITGQFEEQHFEGFIATFFIEHANPPDTPCDEPVEPPCDPMVSSVAAPIVCTPAPWDSHPAIRPELPVVPHSELFPYIYLRKWPGVTTGQRQIRFIGFVQSSPPASSFYDDLCSARYSGRAQMEKLAQDFIHGVAPYQGQYLGGPEQLRDGAENLPKILPLAKQLKQHPETLLAELSELMPQKVRTSSQYQLQLDRVWQSYFALVILPNEDRSWLSQLGQILVGAHLLAILTDANAHLPVVNQCLLQELSNASVILPATVFPLPPWAASPPAATPPGGGYGWIAPSAIGDLQMVRQRLLRYVKGDVAHVENIMRGEIREIGRTRLQRQSETTRTENSTQENLENIASEESNSLQEEAKRALAEKTVINSYKNFQTSYGPPTEATINGSWTEMTRQGSNPAMDDVTRFAQEILNRTVNRITRSVNTARSSSTLNQIEETVKSTIDNSRGEGNLVCVYRWLNKVYEAHVINYGNRLMVEFILQKLADCNPGPHQENTLFSIPIPPGAEGISSFRSITPENYATLAAQYHVTDIIPPPAAQTVSATLRGGEEKLVALPDGYMAVSACVNALAASGTAPVVLVGCEVFNPDDCPAKHRAFGETGVIALAVSGFGSSVSPPASPPAPVVRDNTLVNVVIACQPGESAMDAWRIRIYNAIIAGYQQMRNDYLHFESLRQSKGAICAPEVLRERELRRIKRSCNLLLLERRVEKVGYPPGFSPDDYLACRIAPELMRFSDEVFEWREMTCRFHDCGPGTLAPDDAQGSHGAQPDLVRALVPVRPEYVLPVLYFLSSGMIWSDDMAPVNDGDVPVVNELKTARALGTLRGHCVGKPWEIIVPTSMQMIDGDELPLFCHTPSQDQP